MNYFTQYGKYFASNVSKLTQNLHRFMSVLTAFHDFYLFFIASFNTAMVSSGNLS